MRTTALVTGYIEAALFTLLGVRCVLSWLRQHDRASATLATATVLFGLSSLIGAVTTTLYDSPKGETAPRGVVPLVVAVCLIARRLGGTPDAGTATATITTVGYLAIISAPLLLVGFSPPKWLSARYSPPASA